MKYNILYNIPKNNLEYIDPSNILDSIYFLEYKVPDIHELKKINKDKIFKEYIFDESFINKIKDYISILEYKIPLYDIYTNNIYLINRENIYTRIHFNHYKFPNDIVIKELKKDYESLQKIKTDDVLEIRKRRKYELMINFLDNFNIKLLEDTFYRMIYKYSEQFGKNIIFCKRPSFNKYIHNSKPYYTSTEVINMALNMNNKFDIKDKDLDTNRLCDLVSKNDINYKIISSHQKYIIDENMLGLIQYYTVQGSYFINTYLRNQSKFIYHNTFLDNIILPLWNLCNNSPPFDKDYILYRFITDDTFLSGINIGDIFYDEGFMSTTRDPFYKSEDYQFGFILLKIKIPKGHTGTGLCVENISHFPNEQEILFAPKTKFKLISRDSDIVYYHTDLNISSKIKTRYEFEWVETIEPKISKKKYIGTTKSINFIEEINNIPSGSLDDRIDKFIHNYVDDLNRFICKIGKQEFLTTVEHYNSIGAYKNFYAIETKNGFSMYSIYKNYLLFMIELGTINNIPQMHVNYYVKYNTLNKEDIFTSQEFIDFIGSIGYYFGVDKVFIYPEYKPCIYGKSKLELKEMTQLTGNYCVDFYKYLKNKEKRFFINSINSIDLYSLFSYYDLDILYDISPDKIFDRSDDEIYQIYDKTYKINNPKSSIAEYFIWIIENKCYLIEFFIKKLEKLYKKNNPFKQDLYILNPNNYFYNKNKVKTYNISDNLTYIKERKQYLIPSNEYRLDRRIY